MEGECIVVYSSGLSIGCFIKLMQITLLCPCFFRHGFGKTLVIKLKLWPEDLNSLKSFSGISSCQEFTSNSQISGASPASLMVIQVKAHRAPWLQHRLPYVGSQDCGPAEEAEEQEV